MNRGLPGRAWNSAMTASPPHGRKGRRFRSRERSPTLSNASKRPAPACRVQRPDSPGVLDTPSSRPITSGAMAPFQKSARLQALPRYLFAELERKRREAESAGREVFDLSIGDPDLPTPDFILDRLAQGARDPRHHRYPTSGGLLEARTAVADWFAERFGVAVDPAREIAILIGSKEGIGHFPLAMLDAGDEALLPDPGYPVYIAGTVFAGAKPVRFPIREASGFVPEIKDLESLVTARSRLVFVNYPNNPTGATAARAFYEELVPWAARRDLILVSDAAYSELYYNEPPPSILSIPGAKDRAIEFHSFSKTFNMTGWRIGFAA